MSKRTKMAIIGASALALAASGAGVAAATGGDDSEVPISGTALGKASAAAIEYLGGGRVTDTEINDEDSYYEVEVTHADGSQVDVQLDRGFDVVGDEADSETESEPGDDRPQGTSAAGDLPQGNQPVDLDPANFSADIDNRYWPMVPGTQWTYRETDEEGNKLKVVVTATSETKKIANGITARVVRDTVTDHGELVEDTFDWYAQDEHGNVWYMGEKTAEFENGKVKTKAGSFEAGIDGALPGIIMPAEPVDGMKYRQEYYKGEAEDNGEVLSLDEQAEVPHGHFGRALLTKDTITIEPDVLEYKLYAPNVGPVLVLGVSGGSGREELVDLKRGAKAAEAAGAAPLGSPYLSRSPGAQSS